MKNYDVIVVGAGPAGSATAYYLAKAGKKVLLLEKFRLPRFKPCAGGISAKFLETLPFDVQKAVQATVTKVRYLYNLADQFEAPLASPIIMLNRQKFDHLLVEEAIKQGVCLFDKVIISDIKISDQKVTVITDKGEFTAPYLVGADGVHSQVARSANLCQDRKIGSAIELEIPNSDHDPSIAYFGFGQVAGGYAWIFPKTTYLSVGIGGKGSSLIKQELERWLKHHNLSAEGLRWYAHPLPLLKPGERIARGRVILVGDAAGLVDPLTGEGIRYAIRSGQIAASAMINGDVKSYSRRIYNEISYDFNYTYRFKRVFFRWPQLCYRYGVKNPVITRVLSQIISGDLTYKEAYWNLLKKLNPFSLFKRSKS
ncbi:MAG: geranylgeranyl reductase family protein [bacterium]